MAAAVAIHLPHLSSAARTMSMHMRGSRLPLTSKVYLLGWFVHACGCLHEAAGLQEIGSLFAAGCCSGQPWTSGK